MSWPLLGGVIFGTACVVGTLLFEEYHQGANIQRGGCEAHLPIYPTTCVQVQTTRHHVQARALATSVPIIFHFPEANLSRADMNALRNMTVEPRRAHRGDHHNVTVHNHKANFTAEGFLTDLLKPHLDGMHKGNITMTLHSGEKPIEGSWFFVDRAEANHKVVEEFEKIEEEVQAMNDHHTAVWDILNKNAEDDEKEGSSKREIEEESAPFLNPDLVDKSRPTEEGA